MLDRKWREHLYEMDYLKEGIGLRAMAQRDPLVEYQREGFDMFAAMLDSLKEESVGFLYNLQVQVVPAGEQAPAAAANGAAPVVTAASAAATALSNGGSNGGAPAMPVRPPAPEQRRGDHQPVENHRGNTCRRPAAAAKHRSAAGSGRSRSCRPSRRLRQR